MEQELINKEHWIELCKQYDKWCSYEEIKNLTIKEAEEYIRSMSVWIPQ